MTHRNHFTAITIQILELIPDRRGGDQTQLAAIHKDLEKMKKAYNIGADAERKGTPPNERRDPKRPRLSSRYKR